MQGALLNIVVVVVVVAGVQGSRQGYHPRPSYGAPVCKPSTVTNTATKIKLVTVSHGQY